MNHCKKCGNNIPDHVNDCDEAGFGEDCGNKIATTPTVEEIVRTLAMALTHSEQGHYDKNEAFVRDTISPLVSNTETTNTMTQDYIPESEYARLHEKQDPLVCRVCGAKQTEQHCSVAHADVELRRTDPNYSGVLGLSCNCPQCTPIC